MLARRPRLVLVIVVAIIGASVFALWRIQQARFVLRTSPGIILGSKDPGSFTSPAAWLMPGDTLTSTSYTANQSFDFEYMNAYVIVLSSSPYKLQSATSLSFGLYINGMLKSTRTCLTDNPTGEGGWAGYSSGGNGTSDLSDFECGVSLFRTPFPAGSVLTVTIWSNHPIWVRVDRSPTVYSYETFNVTSTVQPQTINPALGDIAPHTITIDAYSD